MWHGSEGTKQICKNVCMQTIEQLINYKDPRAYLQNSKSKFTLLQL